MASVPQEVPQAPRSTSIDRGVAGRATRALWVAAAVGGLAQSLAGSAGALLAVEVARSDAAGGLPQAVLVAGSAAAALVLSAVAAPRGRRASLATGAGAAVAGCALVTAGAAGSSFAGVLAGSLLPGAGGMTVMPAQYAAADLAADGSRARAMGRLLVATTVGAVLGSKPPRTGRLAGRSPGSACPRRPVRGRRARLRRRGDAGRRPTCPDGPGS